MIVAWVLAHRESGALARDLFAQAYDQQGIEAGQLVVDADRGSAPTAKRSELVLDAGPRSAHPVNRTQEDLH